MILTSLKVKGRPDIQLELPSSIDDVTMEKYLDFNEAYEANRDHEHFELLAIRCVSAFFDIDYHLLLDNQLDSTRTTQLYDAILPVFAHINNVIGSYDYDNTPKQYNIGGNIFTLPFDLVGENSLTVAESIEILEVKRLLDTKGKNGKFTEAIRTAAILLRLEGERLPHDQPDIDQFIQERTTFFLENKLPMRAGIDCLFFLINFTNH